MTRRAIRTENAPPAIGPYSQGLQCGDMFFISGQIPLEPQTGELVEGGVSAQAHQVLRNLIRVLEAAELTSEHVVKTTIYLTQLEDFAEVNAVYASYFAEPYPARATVEVSALPKGVRVEIEAIAIKAAAK